MHVYYLTVRCVIDFIDGEGDGGLADRGGQGLKFSLNLSQIRLNTWGVFSRAVARERSSKFVLRVKVILASESLRVPALLKIPLATAFCM